MMSPETEQELLILRAKVLDMSDRLMRIQHLYDAIRVWVEDCVWVLTETHPEYRSPDFPALLGVIGKRMSRVQSYVAEMGRFL